MMRSLSNEIGDYGEKIFETLIIGFDEENPPCFKAVFLGEKWKDVDFLVELINMESVKPFFFVQVKSTGVKLERKYFPISITSDKLEKLKQIPAPTYLAGVDVKSKKVYLRYISLEMSSPRRIPLKNELTLNNLQILYDEIIDFWTRLPQKQFESKFDL